jgi:hypothetical protein
MRWLSSQERRKGPAVEGMGDGSMRVRCRVRWGARVRAHSSRRGEMEAAGRSEGREREAWMDVKCEEA